MKYICVDDFVVVVVEVVVDDLVAGASVSAGTSGVSGSCVTIVTV